MNSQHTVQNNDILARNNVSRNFQFLVAYFKANY